MKGVTDMQPVIKPSSELRKNYSAEMSRTMGMQGYSIDQFKKNMQHAIKQGARKMDNADKEYTVVVDDTAFIDDILDSRQG